MKKAYCAFNNFNNDAKEIIKNSGINLTIRESTDKPTSEELISILKEYDIIIISIFSKLTNEMLQYIKTPKNI